MRLLAVFVALLLPAAAAATTSGIPTLDAAVSDVAQRPVTLSCETSWAKWTSKVSEGTGGYVDGLTSSVVYVSPRNCETLIALANRADVGSYYAASALLVLAHEGVHLRGVADEGEAECTALPLVPQIAVKYFGVAARVKQRYIGKGLRPVRYKGRTIKVTAPVVRTRMVPNPRLGDLSAMALRWHRSKPAEYRGDC